MNAAELERLIDEYGPQVYRFCLKLTLREPDAQDLYQQVFLTILEQNKEIRRDGNPRAFLFSVAYGIWRNERRKHLRQSAEPVPLELPAADDTEGEVLARLEVREMARAVDCLPPKYRVPLVLRITFQMPLEEIGKLQHIPLGTVKSRLHQAKKLIQKEMEEKGYGKTH